MTKQNPILKTMSRKETCETALQMQACLRLCEVSGRIFWTSRPTPKTRIEIGQEAGTLHYSGYKQFSFRGSFYAAHRVAWMLHHGSWPTGFIDHLNGDRSDNRPANLRVVSTRENHRNRSRHRDGHQCGASRLPHGKWMANIHVNGKRYYLGTYDAEHQAASVYRYVADSEDKIGCIMLIRSKLPRAKLNAPQQT